jgi:hypothetical protein
MSGQIERAYVPLWAARLGVSVTFRVGLVSGDAVPLVVEWKAFDHGIQ